MFYVSDIEAAGGIFIREKLLKKTFKYELIECMLYIAGEKFHVLLKEYKSGKGIVVEVKHENEEDPFKEYDRLEEILYNEEMEEFSFVASNRRMRSINKIKITILKFLNTIVLLQSLQNLFICMKQAALLQPKGMMAITTSIIGIVLLFVIDSMGDRFNRG